MRPLGVPPAALEDETSVEMARVWVAKQGLHCVLNIGTYDDSGLREASAWGVILADMARHVSHALRDGGQEPDAAAGLNEIRQAMMHELDQPTSDIAGTLLTTRQ